MQVLVCIFLWLIVDVIKTMAAKLMAGHFHQETYFQRMQEALRKVLTPFRRLSLAGMQHRILFVDNHVIHLSKPVASALRPST